MLEIKNITKFYGKVKALDDVSLYIPKGCCYGLVGPNGAGKTTLIKIITTIIQKYNGIIEQSDGIKTSYTKREWKYNMGYVPQDICLEERVTAYNNLLFFGRLYGLTG